MQQPTGMVVMLVTALLVISQAFVTFYSVYFWPSKDAGHLLIAWGLAKYSVQSRPSLHYGSILINLVMLRWSQKWS